MTAPGERTDPAPTDEHDDALRTDIYAEVSIATGWLSDSDDEVVDAKNGITDAVMRVVTAALSSARAENERLQRAADEWKAINDRRVEQSWETAGELAACRAECAGLHESLNGLAERAAGDRRALAEARAKLAAVEALCVHREQVGSLSHPAVSVRALRAALAAAQPTKETR